MDSWNEDDDPSKINAKVLIYVILGFLAIGFISVLFIMVPWLSAQENSDWGAILIDNGIILIIAGVFFFGVVMAMKMR